MTGRAGATSRIVIDVDVGVSPIQGWLRTSVTDRGRSFCGWLELSSVLERSRAGTLDEEEEE